MVAHAVEWSLDDSRSAFRIGHFTHISDYKEWANDKSWKENYSTSVFNVRRPHSGIDIHNVICHAGCQVQVEVWSHLRALRNKMAVALIYVLYGFFYLLLGYLLPVRDNASEAVKLLAGVAAFVALFPGLFPGVIMALAGLGFLAAPWVGTECGVGSSHLFFGSKTIDRWHKIFPK